MARRTGLVWITGVEGGVAHVGALLRWRDNKRHAWTYGFRAPNDGSRAVCISDYVGGPVTRWIAYTPRYMQVAVIKRDRELHSSEGSES